MSDLRADYLIKSIELLDNLTLEITFPKSKATVEFALENLCYKNDCPCVFSQIILEEDPAMCIGKNLVAISLKERSSTMEYYNIILEENGNCSIVEFKITLPDSDHKTKMQVSYS